MKEYKIAKGWAIFGYVCIFLLFALLFWLLVMPFILDDTSQEFFYFSVPFFIIGSTFLSIAFLDARKSKIVIKQDTIVKESTLINRSLLFDEIKGFRIDDRYIFIIPKNSKQKKITISTYFGNLDELQNWLIANFNDLDLLQEEEEKKEILKNYEFGDNENKRELKLKQAKTTAQIINGAGMAIFVWVMFFPSPYGYAIILAAALPIICLLVALLFNGLIRLDESKGSAYPSVIYGIMAPMIILLLRAIIDFDIYDYTNVWASSVWITVFLILFALFVSRKHIKKGRDVALFCLLSLFFFGYAYGLVITTNCHFDNSTGESHSAQIINKKIGGGKITTYDLDVSAITLTNDTLAISVVEDFYYDHEVGDSITVYLYQGRLGIPWVYTGD